MKLVELTDVRFNTKEPDKDSVYCYVFALPLGQRVGINIADNGTGRRTDLSLTKEGATALAVALLEAAEGRENESHTV